MALKVDLRPEFLHFCSSFCIVDCGELKRSVGAVKAPCSISRVNVRFTLYVTKKKYIPYSRKLMHNDFNAKEINTKKINANEDQ